MAASIAAEARSSPMEDRLPSPTGMSGVREEFLRQRGPGGGPVCG